MTISNIVKHYRGTRSLRDFAADLGVTHAAVHLWESGENEPTSERIADFVNSEHEWVRDFGKALFLARNGSTLKTIVDRN